MGDTWLTPEEVAELTGLQPNSWAAQRRKLAKMGVPFRPNGAGRPLVERNWSRDDSLEASLPRPHHFEGIGPHRALGLYIAPPPSPGRRLTKAEKAEHAAEVAGRRAAVKRLHESRRREAMPPWADAIAIGRIYADAKQATLATGIAHEVDHIVPLLGRDVCGLHWEGNLRVVTRTVNRAKGNRL